MQIPNLTPFSCTLHQKLLQILYQKTSLPPQIFFSLILLKQSQQFPQLDTTYTLFCLGIIFFVLTCYNHFLLYSAILTSSLGVLGIVNLLVGFLNTNQKWKLYLVWFMVEYYLVGDGTGILDGFVLGTCFVVCVEIYRGFVFPTARDNLAYFTGFFTLFTARMFKNVVEPYSGYGLSKLQLICILPAVALLSFAIIKIRMSNLQPSKIKSPTIFSQYIAKLKTSFNQDQNIHSYMFKHKKQCQQIPCFCQSPQIPPQPQSQPQPSLPQPQKQSLIFQILNHTYTNFISRHRWQEDDKIYLIHKYIQFLIEWEKIAKAMQILSEMDYSYMGYFNRCLNWRMKVEMEAWVDRQEYFDYNRLKLRQICNYDLQVGYVVKEIREILYQKIQLWTELCKQAPQLKYLQRMGIKIVQRIQKLHEYFIFKVRPCSETLSQFKGTIIYATYLFLTTNYTQFAHSLAKKTQKILQESKNQIRCGRQYGLFLRVVSNYEKMMDNMFQLVVTDVSSGLAELIGRNKQDMVLKNLANFIPTHFRSVYINTLDTFIKNGSIQADNYRFLDQSLVIPLKISQTQLILLDITPSLQFDHLSNSITLKCILKKVNDNKTNFFLNLDNQLLYSQSQNYNEVMYGQIVKDTIWSLRESWEREAAIYPVEKTVVINQNSLSFSFQGMYQKEFGKVGLKPIVRLEIRSDNFGNQKLRTPNFALKNRLKNLQGVIQTKESDSQSSNSSRKQSVQNVLTLLMGSSSLKTQIFLAITLLLLLLCSVGSFLICNYLFTPWSTEYKEKNPIFTEINLIHMKNLLNTAMSWNYDVLQYDENQTSTKALFQQLYNGNTDIRRLGQDKLMQIFQSQQNIFNNYILGIQNQLSKTLQSKLTKSSQIQNPSYPLQPPQQTTLKSILTNYIVDIFLLTDNEPFNKTLLSFTYLGLAYTELGVIVDNVKKDLKERIQGIVRNNIVVVWLFSGGLVVFLGPFWRISVGYKRKHVRIYNLLASLDAKLILDQIKKLQKIQSTIQTVGFQSPASSNQINTHSQLSSYQQKSSKKKPQKQQAGLSQVQDLYQGITKLTAQQIANNLKTNQCPKPRKRVGEIVIAGSTCDKKNIRKLDRFLLLFLVLFLAILHALVWYKISYLDQMNHHMDNSIQRIQYLEASSIGLLNSKIYADYYQIGKEMVFQGRDLQGWVEDWIVKHNANEAFDIQNEIEVDTCMKDILLCKSSFSYKIIQNLIKKFITDSYQTSKLQKTTKKPLTQTQQKSRFQLYFAQQISDHESSDKLKHLIQSFTQLQQKQKQYLMRNKLIAFIFFVTSVSFSGFAVYYTIKVKENYVKEVTILSILNKEMLYNNKMVESFLHQLSKDS